MCDRRNVFQLERIKAMLQKLSAKRGFFKIFSKLPVLDHTSVVDQQILIWRKISSKKLMMWIERRVDYKWFGL